MKKRYQTRAELQRLCRGWRLCTFHTWPTGSRRYGWLATCATQRFMENLHDLQIAHGDHELRKDELHESPSGIGRVCRSGPRVTRPSEAGRFLGRENLQERDAHGGHHGHSSSRSRHPLLSRDRPRPHAFPEMKTSQQREMTVNATATFPGKSQPRISRMLTDGSEPAIILSLQGHFFGSFNHGFHGCSRVGRKLSPSYPWNPGNPWSIPRSVAVRLARLPQSRVSLLTSAATRFSELADMAVRAPSIAAPLGYDHPCSSASFAGNEMIL